MKHEIELLYSMEELFDDSSDDGFYSFDASDYVEEAVYEYITQGARNEHSARKVYDNVEDLLGYDGLAEACLGSGDFIDYLKDYCKTDAIEKYYDGYEGDTDD